MSNPWNYAWHGEDVPALLAERDSLRRADHPRTEAEAVAQLNAEQEERKRRDDETLRERAR